MTNLVQNINFVDHLMFQSIFRYKVLCRTLPYGTALNVFKNNFHKLLCKFNNLGSITYPNKLP